MREPFLPGVARGLARILARPPRAAWAVGALVWAGVLFALSARPADPAVAQPFLVGLLHNAAHAPIYAILGALLLLAFAPRPGPTPGSRPFRMAFALALLYALSDEWHQRFVPGRVASAVDVATDVLGAACGLAVLRWALGGGKRAGVAFALAAAAAASALLATAGPPGI